MTESLNTFELVEGENLAANRVVTFTNSDGVSITFNEQEFSPYILASVKDLYTMEYNVYTSQNTMVDGATYQGSVAKQRNLIVTVKDLVESGFARNRGLLDEVFKPNSKGTMQIEDINAKPKIIDYYVEKMTSTANHDVRTHVISLICPDPFFYAKNDAVVNIAEWNGAFEFQHEFLDEKEEFGWRSQVRMRTIENLNSNDNIGMDITVTCVGAVTNPSITIVETQEKIKFGSQASPFVLYTGDVLRITTGTGNKHVFLTRNGVTSEINYLMTEDSKFIQLKRGTNTIGYDADAGADYLVLRIKYRLVYPRA